MSQIIILDRDGVINQDSDDYIKSVDEFIPIPGSLEAIAQLCQAGYAVLVATNQSGISRHFFTLETLEAMHTKLQSLLAPLGGKIERFYYCPHGPDDQCACRKPKPGMLTQIADDFSDLLSDSSLLDKSSLPAEGSLPAKGFSSLSNVYYVGDSLTDMQAGRAAGTKIALVKTGKGIRSLKKIDQNKLTEYSQLAVYTDLADFTQQLLNPGRIS